MKLFPNNCEEALNTNRVFRASLMSPPDSSLCSHFPRRSRKGPFASVGVVAVEELPVPLKLHADKTAYRKNWKNELFMRPT
jgi:hypothetical protein